MKTITISGKNKINKVCPLHIDANQPTDLLCCSFVEFGRHVQPRPSPCASRLREEICATKTHKNRVNSRHTSICFVVSIAELKARSTALQRWGLRGGTGLRDGPGLSQPGAVCRACRAPKVARAGLFSRGIGFGSPSSRSTRASPRHFRRVCFSGGFFYSSLVHSRLRTPEPHAPNKKHTTAAAQRRQQQRRSCTHLNFASETNCTT